MDNNRIPITRLTAFFKAFPDEKSGEDYLFSLLYPNVFVCPKCAGSKFGRIEGRRELQCPTCKHQTSLTAGTMMESTKLPLRKWFLAIFLITHDKRGYSAMALAHELKVQWRTADYLLKRIRAAMTQKVIPNVLGGLIELDDAYIGSKSTTQGRGTDKTPFLIAVEKRKGGEVALRATKSVKGADYKLFARDHIARSATIKSDASTSIKAGLSSYAGLDSAKFDDSDEDRSLPTVHHLISNFKTMIRGTYHGVSKRLLQSYMDEFSYRYNNRRNINVFHTLLSDICFVGKCSKSLILEFFELQDIEKMKVA